jgi:uncharacterized protein YjbJ (UPF0337 family)
MGDSIPEAILVTRPAGASRVADSGLSIGGTASIQGRCLNETKTSEWSLIMDREQIKGAADKAKGAVKDAAGKMTGDKELQSEGKLDKAKGEAHNAAGDVKDAFRNQTK